MSRQATGESVPGRFKSVAVLYHPKIEVTQVVAQEVQGWLAAKGLSPWLAPTWDEEHVRAHLPETDLVIVLGGDGSTLRVARMSAGLNLPIIALNMGRLGFLAEMQPSTWRGCLGRVLAGDYWIEERMMLTAESWRGGESIGQHIALNDVVVSRGSLARMVRLRTEIDGDELTTYIADGLIVSTPTGSTAYALAVGGPILPPALHNILVIPIAPHMTLDRAIVLSEGCNIRIHISTDHQAILTVDGQFEFELKDGDHVDVRASEVISHFIRLGKQTYFYHTLLARLEPKRPSHEG